MPGDGLLPLDETVRAEAQVSLFAKEGD